MNRKDYEDLKKIERQDFKEAFGEVTSLLLPWVSLLLLLICAVFCSFMFDDLEVIKTALCSSGGSL